MSNGNGANEKALELVDVTKAFGHVTRATLHISGRRCNYPTILLRCSLGSYAWPKRRLLDGMVSPDMFSHRGVGAGSTGATFEIACYVYQAGVDVHPTLSTVYLSIHVDDVSQTARRGICAIPG